MHTAESTILTPPLNGAEAPFVERRSHRRVALGPGSQGRIALPATLDIRPLHVGRRLESVRQASRLDGDTRRAVDGLTALATRVLGVPVALVTLVAADRQFLLSVRGLNGWWPRLGETPIEYSLCRHVVATGTRLVIPDTRVDPLSADNPLVLETGVRAYAGSPVRARDGLCLGAFAALSFAPRAWAESDLAILDELAALAGLEIARAMQRASSHARSSAPDAAPTERHGATASTARHDSAPVPVVASTNALLRFWSELQTRRVVRVVVVYLAAAWLVINVSSEVLPPLGLPDSVQTLIVLLAALGLPLVSATAWAFDLTDSGIVRAPVSRAGHDAKKG